MEAEGQRWKGTGDRRQAGGDLVQRGQLINIEAGRRMRAKIMEICLRSQNRKAWAFSETGIWSFFTLLKSDWKFHPLSLVSHVRCLHIPKHDLVGLGLSLVLGTSTAGTRYR